MPNQNESECVSLSLSKCDAMQRNQCMVLFNTVTSRFDKLNVTRTFFVLITFHLSLFTVHFSSAQDKEIRIVNADLLEYHEDFGKKIETLTGNVQLEQEGVTLYCNQADFNTVDNVVDASGNVHIQQDTVNIYSEKLHYDGNNRKARLNGNVHLTDTKMNLVTDQLDYDMNSRVASYYTGGVLSNDSSVLKSQIGYYYAATKDVYFKDSVHLTNPRYTLTADTLRYNLDSKTAHFLGPTNITGEQSLVYCEGGYFNTGTDRMQFTQNAWLRNESQLLEADTIEYGRKSGDGLALGHVRWTDTIQKTILIGGRAVYNETTDLLVATKTPVMIDASRDDTMFLTADTLYSLRIDTTGKRQFRAYHTAKVFSDDMQAVCDSLVYSDADSVFHFYKDPILWVNQNQLTADSIYMRLRKGEIDKVYLRQNSLIVSLSDTGQYNQVRGKYMTGNFKDNRMQNLLVEGNGESVYYAKEDNGKQMGVNKAVCSRMMVIVKENDVQRIVFLDKPDATLYPISQAPPEELKLKGFRWEAAKLPARSLFSPAL